MFNGTDDLIVAKQNWEAARYAEENMIEKFYVISNQYGCEGLDLANSRIHIISANDDTLKALDYTARSRGRLLKTLVVHNEL